MHIAIQKILKLKSQISLVQIYNTLMVAIVIIILLISSIALSQPISKQQFMNVTFLAKQAAFPKTQEMAKNLIQNYPIRTVEYFRLMRAHQFEQARAKQLPAFAPDNP